MHLEETVADIVVVSPDQSNRQHLNYGDFLAVMRESNQNCYVLYCVQQLCTMIWACWFRFIFCFCVFV